MATPKAHTLTDIFLPDGYGAFGYGSGGFGGTSELLNPQWNTNSGSFGIDVVSGLPFIEATSTPSYVGATAYDIRYDSFFAKIQVAPFGNGSIQTGLIVKFDAINYVEMSVGPSGVFNAYGSNNNSIVLPSTALPNYDPTAHAYWRIRNDGILFHFDASPDGTTWTELANVPYTWDASSTTVMIFAGFNGSENPGQVALISHVNLSGANVGLSATTKDTFSASGIGNATVPFTLASRTTDKFNVSAKFTATLGIPEGGVTDFAYASNAQQTDPIISVNFGGQSPAAVNNNGSTNRINQTDWARTSNGNTVPSPYRDGSYFAPANYIVENINMSFGTADTQPMLFTQVQSELTSGYTNRLSVNSSTYLTGTFYAPGPGVTQVVRSTAQALNGPYSGAISSTVTPTTLGNGQLGYFVWPTSVTLVPVKHDTIPNKPEGLFGSVYLNTARANTQWFASFIFYDSSFNILSGSTYLQASITNINTHPGSNIWQNGVVESIPYAPTNAAWVGVVPVVLNPSSLAETVYTSNPNIQGATLLYSETPTAYNNPNTLNVNIKADRVNYVQNGGFNVQLSRYSQVNTNTTGTPNPVTFSWDGTTGYNGLGSAKLTFTTISGTFNGGSNSQMGFGSPFVFNGTGSIPVIQGLKVGHTYTVSAWVKQGPGCPDVFMNCLDSNFAASGNGVAGISTNQSKSAGNTVNGWTQISGTFTVPFNGLPDMGLFFYVRFQDYFVNQNFSFWVDSIMLEESDSVGTFFDARFAGADYQVEAGNPFPDDFVRAYYYKNFTNKVNRLNVALPNVIPLGASYNLQFAQPIQPL